MSELKPLEDMEFCLETIRQAPAAEGSVDMIVIRPETGKRLVAEAGELDKELGLVGDNWLRRGDKHKAEGSADPGRQLTLMGSRAIAAITDSEHRWPEAGDQFFVDFDLSNANIPPGTRLAIGDAEIEVTELPHLGCAKFGAHFGKPAIQFVNSGLGKSLNLRGINARIVKPGMVSKGDTIRKI